MRAREEDFDELLSFLASASEAERDRTLAELARQAEDSSLADDYWDLAIASRAAERYSTSLELLTMLYEHFNEGDSEEDAWSRDRVAFDRAETQFVAGNLATAGQQFAALAALAGDERIAKAARARGSEVARTHTAVMRDAEYTRLKVAWLHERVAGGEASPTVLRALGRGLLRLGAHDNDRDLLLQAREAFELTLASDPSDQMALEHLLATQLKVGSEEEVKEVARKLHAIAPNSPILTELLDSHEGSLADDFADELTSRVWQLTTQLADDNVAVREAAVADLAKIVAQFPGNSRYRTFYALALMAVDRINDSVRQAQIVSRSESLGFEQHFNLVLVYEAAGELEAVRAHLTKAEHLATDPEDFEVVADARARLEGTPTVPEATLRVSSRGDSHEE